MYAKFIRNIYFNLFENGLQLWGIFKRNRCDINFGTCSFALR